MHANPPQLRDGSEWADHEDCIIGDESGLRNLIRACETALEKGEYYGSDLGDYVGVKKLESSWFNNPMELPSARLANKGLAIFLVVVAALFVIGIGTAIKWVF